MWPYHDNLSWRVTGQDLPGPANMTGRSIHLAIHLSITWANLTNHGWTKMQAHWPPITQLQTYLSVLLCVLCCISVWQFWAKHKAPSTETIFPNKSKWYVKAAKNGGSGCDATPLLKYPPLARKWMRHSTDIIFFVDNRCVKSIFFYLGRFFFFIRTIKMPAFYIILKDVTSWTMHLDKLHCLLSDFSCKPSSVSFQIN